MGCAAWAADGPKDMCRTVSTQVLRLLQQQWKAKRQISLPADQAAFPSPAQVALPGCRNTFPSKSELDISQQEANVNEMGEEIKLCTVARASPSVHQKCGIIGQGITVHIKEKNFHHNIFIRIHNKHYLFIYTEL